MSKYKYYLTRKGRLDGGMGLCEIRSIENDEQVYYNGEDTGGLIEPKQVKALVDFYTFNGWIQTIMGKVLTIIDSSILDERQNKAVKDTLKEVVYSYTHGHIQEMFEGHPEVLIKKCSCGEHEVCSNCDKV